MSIREVEPPPCYNCVCLPICRNKEYKSLIECEIVSTYLCHGPDTHRSHCKTLERVLRPTLWKLGRDTRDTLAYIVDKKYSRS